MSDVEVSLSGAKLSDMVKDNTPSAFMGAFRNSRLEQGKLGFFESVDEVARENGVKKLPVYDKFKKELDLFAEHGKFSVGGSKASRQRYLNAKKNKVFRLDDNDNLVKGEKYQTFGFALFDDDVMKGYLLAEKYGLNEEFEYKNVVEKEQREISQAPNSLTQNILGSISGFLASPQTLAEVAVSPAYVGGKTVIGGMANAFTSESLAVLPSEISREIERRDHYMSMGKDIDLMDSVKEIAINSGFAGALRGLGSGVSDALLVRKLKNKTPNALDQEIMEEFAQVQEQRLYNLKDHISMLDMARESFENGKIPTMEQTEIDIATKADYNDIASLDDEIANQPEVKQDNDFLEQYTRQQDDDIKAGDTDALTPEEDEILNEYLTSGYLNDSLDSDEIKEIEELRKELGIK